LPGKIESYSGPKYHEDICRQISIDAAANGMNVPDSMVDYIVGRFFYRIKANMRIGNKIIIEGFGILGLSPKERKKRIEKHRTDHYKKMEISAKISKRREFNKDVKHKFKRFNRRRVELGQKEWTFTEWSKMTGIQKMPRNYRKGWYRKTK